MGKNGPGTMAGSAGRCTTHPNPFAWPGSSTWVFPDLHQLCSCLGLEKSHRDNCTFTLVMGNISPLPQGDLQLPLELHWIQCRPWGTSAPVIVKVIEAIHYR